MKVWGTAGTRAAGLTARALAAVFKTCTRKPALMARGRAAVLLAVLLVCGAVQATDSRRSGLLDLRPETQAMQRDDSANPGMLSVLEGAALWRRKAGAAQKACADCHGEPAAMKGVASRYPAFDEPNARPVTLDQRIAACQVRHQQAPPWRPESPERLAISALVTH
ncbi:MAG TPA: hypothetical protein PK359_21045, partial [Burkholderiaceae bacterium]|nr:hypothetical protein [Burkholderiaceae bacterium]